MLEGDDFKNSVIWIDHKDNLESLSHEILHLIFDWLEHKGVSLTNKTDEIYTLLHSFYFRKCLECLGLDKFKAK